MRLGLLAAGLLVSTVHLEILADDGTTKQCPPDCTITITIVDDGTTCKPKAPTRVEVTHTSANPVTVTWEVDAGNTFRFSKGKEGEKPGIDLETSHPSYDDDGSTGPSGAAQKKYKWKVQKPLTADDKRERKYAVRTVRRSNGNSCDDVDPVIVNMN
jgi:hypothetical protein